MPKRRKFYLQKLAYLELLFRKGLVNYVKILKIQDFKRNSFYVHVLFCSSLREYICYRHCLIKHVKGIDKDFNITEDRIQLWRDSILGAQFSVIKAVSIYSAFVCKKQFLRRNETYKL